MKSVVFVFVGVWLALAMPLKAGTNTVAESEATYSRTLTQRVEKIVASLNLVDAAKSNRVHEIIVQHYRALRQVHEARDAKVKAVKAQTGGTKDSVAAAIKAAQEEAHVKIEPLHKDFLEKLSTELSPEQVDQVKDGMTYGVVPLTYGVYLKMYPELMEEQKAQIKAWLIEARESAMDGSTSDEKHAVFGKYKGRINNYLSKAGYDAKKGEQNLKKATAPPDAKPK